MLFVWRDCPGESLKSLCCRLTFRLPESHLTLKISCIITSVGIYFAETNPWRPRPYSWGVAQLSQESGTSDFATQSVSFVCNFDYLVFNALKRRKTHWLSRIRMLWHVMLWLLSLLLNCNTAKSTSFNHSFSVCCVGRHPKIQLT